MAIYYTGIPLLMLAAVFDTTIMTLFRIWGGGPNLVLIIVVSWALLVDIREALPWAVIGGVMRDLLSIAPTGTSALLFVLIVIAIDTYLPQVDYRNVVLAPIVVAIATVIYDFGVIAILILSGRPVPDPVVLTYVILPGLVENAIFILVVFRIMGAINAFLRPSRPGLT